MSQTESNTSPNGNISELPDKTLLSDEDATDARDEDEPIDRDELFHLLQNQRRRAVVRYLSGREDPVKMRDIAEQVAAWEHDTTVQALRSDQRQRVYIALYQSHLDTLADADIIDYNKSRGIVEPKPLVEYVAKYVENSSPPTEERIESDGKWQQRYLGVSFLGLLLLVSNVLNLPYLQFVSGFLLSIVILAMFSLVTVANLTLNSEGSV